MVGIHSGERVNTRTIPHIGFDKTGVHGDNGSIHVDSVCAIIRCSVLSEATSRTYLVLPPLDKSTLR